MGALVAQIPDGTVIGGNARGANAVDLQTTRNAAAQVASGANSTVGGGERNTASGTRATVAGGVNNTASGANATVGGGNGNVASGSNAVVAGGLSNSAVGATAWVPGGESAHTRNQQMGAWASGSFATLGDAQAGERVLRRITTDAAPLRLSTANADPVISTLPVLQAGAASMFRLLVVAYQTGGSAGAVGDSAAWDVTVLLHRPGAPATTSYVGGTVMTAAPAIANAPAGTPLAPTHSIAATAGWRLTLDADTTLGGLSVSVTGEANKTIRWVARVMSVEVTA